MKNQIKLVVLLSLFPMLLLAQSKFSGGVNIGTELSFMKIDQVNAPTGSGIEEKGETALGYLLGVHLNYQFSSKVHLRSGLTYRHSVQQHRIDGLRFGSDINGTDSHVINRMIISSVGIPLEFVYKAPLKSEQSKWLFGLGAVVNLNFEEQSKSKVYIGDAKGETLTDDQNTIDASSFSFVFLTGYETSLKNNMLVSIEPYFKLTPNDFTLALYESEASTTFELGLTVRLGLF